jgi:virulence factor Mce-like protein
VRIGRVVNVVEQDVDGAPAAKVTLDVDPKYIDLIPSNVDANIAASTVFGNKYVSFASPKDPTPQRITSRDVIDARSVTTEDNTLFETITQIATRVDPIKLNATLTAAALALDGLGTKFGQSIVNGNDILADLNPQMPQLRYDTQRLADLADLYTNASPDLWAFLNNALTTAHTFNDQQANLDATLLASIGVANTGADILTGDEVDHAADLEIVCGVDGIVKQRSRTSQLIFTPDRLVAHVSSMLTLEPGDLILTGTPGGVGAARTPPERLVPCSSVTTRIEGIGELHNVCISEDLTTSTSPALAATTD